MFHKEINKITQTQDITPFHISRDFSYILESDNQMKHFEYNEFENIIFERICNKGFVKENNALKNIVFPSNVFLSLLFNLSDQKLILNFETFSNRISDFFDCNFEMNKILFCIKSIILNKQK